MAFSPMHVLARMVGRNRSRLLFHHRPLHAPVGLGLQAARGRRRPRIQVVDEHHAMSDEDVIFNADAFADKSMAGDLATLAHRRVSSESPQRRPIFVSSPISQP